MPAAMRTRVAAIGVNHWHSLWDASLLRHLAGMEDVEIVGIHDDNLEIASHRAEAVGGAIPTYTDYPEMISKVNPDFVLALGRHDQMAGTALYLLDIGIPFIMEKPMSYSARQLRGVVAKADATDGFAAVPLAQRYQPLIQYARSLIDEDAYGPMTHFYFRMNRPSSTRYPEWGSGWMLDPTVSNGGCLRNLGAHGFDAFVHLTGEREDIEVTGAQLGWTTHRQSVEDYASVLVRSGNGVIGTIEVGNCFPREGTDSEMKVGFRDALLTLKDGHVILGTADGESVVPDLDAHPGPGGALRMTIDAAAADGRPPIDIHDCYRAVRLIDLAYLAAGNPYKTAEV
jgi:predicted dehydrogenase